MKPDKSFRLDKPGYKIQVEVQNDAACLFDEDGLLKKNAQIRLKISPPVARKTWVDYINKWCGSFLTIE